MWHLLWKLSILELTWTNTLGKGLRHARNSCHNKYTTRKKCNSFQWIWPPLLVFSFRIKLSLREINGPENKKIIAFCTQALIWCYIVQKCQSSFQVSTCWQVAQGISMWDASRHYWIVNVHQIDWLTSQFKGKNQLSWGKLLHKYTFQHLDKLSKIWLERPLLKTNLVAIKQTAGLWNID